MYIMPNVLCFLGGKCFYFNRSALATFCEQEFIFEFEVPSFKLHFFSQYFFFILKTRRQSRYAIFIYIQVFKEIRKKRKIKESIKKK